MPDNDSQGVESTNLRPIASHTDGRASTPSAEAHSYDTRHSATVGVFAKYIHAASLLVLHLALLAAVWTSQSAHLHTLYMRASHAFNVFAPITTGTSHTEWAVYPYFLHAHIDPFRHLLIQTTAQARLEGELRGSLILLSNLAPSYTEVGEGDSGWLPDREAEYVVTSLAKIKKISIEVTRALDLRASGIIGSIQGFITMNNFTFTDLLPYVRSHPINPPLTIRLLAVILEDPSASRGVLAMSPRAAFSKSLEDLDHMSSQSASVQILAELLCKEVDALMIHLFRKDLSLTLTMDPGTIWTGASPINLHSSRPTRHIESGLLVLHQMTRQCLAVKQHGSTITESLEALEARVRALDGISFRDLPIIGSLHELIGLLDGLRVTHEYVAQRRGGL